MEDLLDSPAFGLAPISLEVPEPLEALRDRTEMPLEAPQEPDAISMGLSAFFQKGFVKRRDAKWLMSPQDRQEAEKRLQAVGLSMAWSPYSRYCGLALAQGAHQNERITNMGELDRNALALLVILWARLVLPARLAEEGREGGVSDPTVSLDTLSAEFGKKLGGRRFEMYVSQLKRLGFLDYTRKDDIKAGPFLDLLGDANQLASYLRQSTLGHVMRSVGLPPEPQEDEDEEEETHV
jgi:hypothetical protein